MRKFGDFIKNKRLDKMTQRELARKIGIGYPYLSKLENNIEPPPSEEVLLNLSKVLNINVDDIFFIAEKLPSYMKSFILRDRYLYELIKRMRDYPMDLRDNLILDIYNLLDAHDNKFHESKQVKFIINPSDFKIIDANRSAIDFYGFTRETFCNMAINDINCLPKEIIKLKMDQARNGAKDSFYFTHKLANNIYKDVHVSSHPYSISSHTYLCSVISEVN